jgi:DNA (cytosine-5)-methyltransferase 1
MRSRKQKDATALDLFAGAGGLALGAHRAGFRTLAVLELERNCLATLERNALEGKLRRWQVVNADLRHHDFSEFEDEVTLLTAGVPCQPFSLGGKHLGHEDERNLFPIAIKAVRQIRPRAILFENVKGLLRGTFREFFEYVLLHLELPTVEQEAGEDWRRHKARLLKATERKCRFKLTYEITPQLLNAADFGVPQRRERVFIVGFRSDIGAKWKVPEPTHTAQALEAAKFDGSYWQAHGLPPKRNGARAANGTLLAAGERWRTVRDALAGLPEPKPKIEHPTFSNHAGNPGARPYKGHDGSPWDEPAKTLKAGVHGVPGGENTLQLPDGSVRYFTGREGARIQTFPDEYVFSGPWSETMRQIGNAVPVRLAEYIARRISTKL